MNMRIDEFSLKLDAIDTQIAKLIVRRWEHFNNSPDNYNPEGEGQVYHNIVGPVTEDVDPDYAKQVAIVLTCLEKP